MNLTSCRTIPPRAECGDPQPVEKKITPNSAVEQNLNSLLDTRIAGDPEEATIVFTDLSPRALSRELDALGTPASDDTIRQWMDDEGWRLRKIRKVLAGGSSPDRDPQFQQRASLIGPYQAVGNPCLSMDTTAKEHLGKLFRAGRIRSSKALEAFDHDFPSWADGVIIPHGIDDLARHRGHLHIGLSHDTSPFACDSLLWYWNRIGKQGYPAASSILM